MGKGKPIYSSNVLGNRVGEKKRKKRKGFRKDFTHVQGKQTKEEHGMEREVELQSLQVDFQKEFHLHIVD